MPKAAKKTEAAETKTIVAYKGFGPDMKCRDFQYKVGETYKHDGDVQICAAGFHACENPWDVLNYYPLIDDDCRFNRFGETKLGGELARHSDDSKIAAAEITVSVEFSTPQWIGRLVDWIIDAAKPKPGDVKDATTDLNDNGGNYAQIGSSGNYARIGSSGDSAQIGSSGDSARINASGENAVIASAGHATRVRAKAGAWVSVAEFNGDGKCIGFATGCIGQDDIPADTWLIAKGGKLVPAA